MKIEFLNENSVKKEMLPQIIDRIFSICKTDPHFKLKEEIESVEDRINIIENKNKKQLELLKKSEELTKDVKRRISLIDDDNESKRIELLENLGSEI